MNDLNTPYQTIDQQILGLGVATALESTELEDSVPIAENPNEVNREATRYLFLAGDKRVPEMHNGIPNHATSGEYYGQQYKTLVRSKGLLRRCQITPMEVGFDFMSADMVGDDANLHVVTTVNHNSEGRGALQASPAGQLNGIKTYPGDEIKGILQGERNNTMSGTVEISELAGVEYSEFKKSRLQEFVFPEWPKIIAGASALPKTLAELQQHLTSRKNSTDDRAIRSIIDRMLLSCEQYFNWGRNYVKFASQLVRLPAYQGFVHTYSPLGEYLFEVLELRREDMISSDREMADIFAKAQAGNATDSDVKDLLAKMTDVMATLVGQIPKDKRPVETIAEDKAICTGTKADGEPCGAAPVEGSDRCRHHPNV